MNRRTIALSFAALLALAACGEPAADQGGTVPPSTNGTNEPASGLAGTSWVVVSIGIDGADDPVLVDAVPTIEFDAAGTAAGGTTGCNTWFGTVALSSGTTISFTELGWTEMACMGEGVMEQEQRFVAALANVDGFALSTGSLVLEASDGSAVIHLSPAGSAASLPIDGDWRLTTFVDEDVAMSVLAGTEITLTLDLAAGTLAGNAGCNGFSGGMTVDADADGRTATVEVGPPASTMMACEPDVMDQELMFHEILSAATTLRSEGGFLSVTTDDGRALVFEPAEA